MQGRSPAPLRTDPARWPWVLGLLGATLLAYLPCLRGSLVWEDSGHVTPPALRSLAGLRRIWCELGATQQYYPVLHSAFWLEHRLWGDSTLGYHLANVLWHGISACLLVVILSEFAAAERGGEKPAGVTWPWIAGMTFALHPLCVESVAWISEQENTLSGVFYLAAGLTFLRWHRRQAAPPERGRFAAYLLASLLFVLALLSKTVTATLPAGLLVLLWWRQGRLSWRRDLLPLLPWLGAGAAASLFTAWIEGHLIGAAGAAFSLSGLQRCLVASRALWFYLGKVVWPADLTFSYPHWTVDPRRLGQDLAAVAILLLTFALWLPLRIWGSRPVTRAPLAGFLFFAGALFPSLGFLNAFPFRYSYVADHFAYLALLGPVSLLAAAWGFWQEHLRKEEPTGLGRGQAKLYLQTLAAFVALGSLTWLQSRDYRNSEILYRATLARNPTSWLAENNLRIVLAAPASPPAQLAEAIAQFARAVELDPRSLSARTNLAMALHQSGRFDEAIAQYRAILRLRPDRAEIHRNLGLALRAAGREEEAEAELAEAGPPAP